jgi:ubiquinone/menaquinone biosynthesis C-methylase UbiE
VSHAEAGYWDAYFADLRQAGDDLDWGERWTAPFVPRLREARARHVLELGCGTGNDAARLAREGLEVVAVDFSMEALNEARRKYGEQVEFRLADLSEPLPFTDGSFDAVMSNVALHMFSDGVTRAVFAEVLRVLRPGGVFLFHVNALDDRPLRARWRTVARELEPNYVLEEVGQTVRFFPQEYLVDLLDGCTMVELEHIEIEDRETGEPFKRVWRGFAQRRSPSAHAKRPKRAN